MPVVRDQRALQSGVTWTGIESHAAPIVVTFSFPATAPDYLLNAPELSEAALTTFAAFSGAQQAQARAALAEWGQSGLLFVEVADGKGDINFQSLDLTTAGHANVDGLAFAPRGELVHTNRGAKYNDLVFRSGHNLGGDVFMDTAAITNGEMSYSTLLHEIGHALGFKHPTEIVDNGVVIHDSVLANDDPSLTIMASSNESVTSSSGHLTMLDIKTVQSTYGYAYSHGIVTGSASGQVGDGYSNIIWTWDEITQVLSQSFKNDNSNPQRGSPLDDVITGHGWILGLEGNDRLTADTLSSSQYRPDFIDGGSGADIMAGGGGSDTYYVDDIGDKVVEEAINVGISSDLVLSSIDYTLPANVENLRLVGANLIGHGNAADNVLYADGMAASTLIGGTGNDTYYIYNPADVIVETAAQGRDTVVSTLDFAVGQLSIEIVRLSGGADLQAVGNSQVNALYGNDGDNRIEARGGSDVLDGGLGADLMIGGRDSDTYYVDNSADVVIEAQSKIEGQFDVVYASASFDLAHQFVEKLELTGKGDLDAFGNSQANLLVGNAGDNLLDGRGGADEMIGGAGDDRYRVDDVGDYVDERQGRAEGYDTIYSSVNISLAGTFVEELFLTGTANLTGVGNSLSNVIRGNQGDNWLAGRGGGDTFVFSEGWGKDIIQDFNPAIDLISFDKRTFSDFDDLLSHARQSGANVVIDDYHGNFVLLENLALSSVSSDQFAFY